MFYFKTVFVILFGCAVKVTTIIGLLLTLAKWPWDCSNCFTACSRYRWL